VRAFLWAFEKVSSGAFRCRLMTGMETKRYQWFLAIDFMLYDDVIIACHAGHEPAFDRVSGDQAFTLRQDKTMMP
jgi:hypothetical protein